MAASKPGLIGTCRVGIQSVPGACSLKQERNEARMREWFERCNTFWLRIIQLLGDGSLLRRW
jgi:hypothetical protein